MMRVTMTDNVRIETSCIRNSRGKLIRHLVIDDVIWMSNDHVEYKDIDRAIKNAHGNCFVGGLGLGLIVEELLNKKEVNSIKVVEINDNIRRLVAPNFGAWYRRDLDCYLTNDGRLKIYCGDATKDFFAESNEYDYVYADFWLEPTSEAKQSMELCFNNIKPYTKENAIFEAWLKPKLDNNDFWT
jgi:spermidine synthase